MSIQPAIFEEFMAQFASGVTVITTGYEGAVHGMTATSFCILSLEPSLILVCVAQCTRSHALIQKSGVFAVNILSADQLEWGLRFAGLIPKIEDRFAGIAYHPAATGSPILPGVLSWLDCNLRDVYAGGDHSIFVGEVIACDIQGDGPPLLYYKRRWRQLAEPVLQP